MIFRAKHTCLLTLFLANICNYGDAFSFRNDNNCTTENKSGNCIAVSECEYAISIIKRSRISSTESQRFLELNQCGFEGITPKICCPEKKIIVDSRNTFKQEDSQILDSNKKKYDNPKLPDEKNTFSLLSINCGVQLSIRIMGGEDTKLNEFPWIAALEYEEIGSKDPIIGCSGSLITQRYVLTAAHCIRTTSNVRLTNVRLGEYNIITESDCVHQADGKKTCADPILSVPIESKIVHEDFMSPKLYRNDIGLLRLAYDVPYTNYIQPICLPSVNNNSEIYWSAGWGETETKRNSDAKLKVPLPYFDFQQCAAKYRTRKIILGKGQMCAGGQAAKDTCKGDSGAPLMRQIEQIGGNDLWIIEGVLSLGTYDCGTAKWPAVYTKVYDYLPWILNKIES